jgi:alkylation response protein AidB-like acyl-CoA dehydrogenase
VTEIEAARAAIRGIAERRAQGLWPLRPDELAKVADLRERCVEMVARIEGYAAMLDDYRNVITSIDALLADSDADRVVQ